MSLQIKTGFESITYDIQFNPNTIRKGKELKESSHVVRVEELRNNNVSYMIRCHVIPETSISAIPYQVSLCLSAEREVIDTACTCVSQAGKKCKHIFALIHYINTDRSSSKTSHEQKWGKPSVNQIGREMYAKGVILKEVSNKRKIKIFNIKGTKKKKIIEDSKSYNIQPADLQNSCGLRKLLIESSKSENERSEKKMQQEPIFNEIKTTKDALCMACIKKLLILPDAHKLYSLKLEEEILVTENQVFYHENVILSESEIIDLCIKTREQSKCSQWSAARNIRISASQRAHSIKSRKTKSITSLINDFLSPSECKGKAKKNMQYGTKNELKAILEYEKLKNVQVIAVGVIVSKTQPWICASPDGVVIEDACISKLLEVKCPSSCEILPVVDFHSQTINVKYLHFVNGNLELKTSHIYFTQCQLQLYVSGLTVCDLYLWSPKGSCLVAVYRDEGFLKRLIPKLEIFFFRNFLEPLVLNFKENDINQSIN